MNYSQTAQELTDALGGMNNVLASDVHMTRLRISLDDSSLVDLEKLNAIQSVLGVSKRSTHAFDIVFGPSVVEGVYTDFARITNTVGRFPKTATSGNRPQMSVHISPGERQSFAAQAEALARMMDTVERSNPTEIKDEQTMPTGPSLLVINGPNINMLGIREPDMYGKEDFATLLELCRTAAADAGFAKCRCYQSNHEGDLVDEIQRALGTYDGIVMNPGAYTHTSIALLDALKSVQIPCVEVHISKVEEREDFRQVSYVRQACFETITGLGIEGYRKAIFDLKAYLEQA